MDREQLTLAQAESALLCRQQKRLRELADCMEGTRNPDERGLMMHLLQAGQEAYRSTCQGLVFGLGEVLREARTRRPGQHQQMLDQQMDLLWRTPPESALFRPRAALFRLLLLRLLREDEDSVRAALEEAGVKVPAHAA
jgi:hypothetical protein